MEVVVEETKEDEEFDGGATMRAGQLSAAKRKHAATVKAVKMYTEEEFEIELEKRCDDLAEKINNDCLTEVTLLKEKHKDEVQKLKMQLEEALQSRAKYDTDKWSLGKICTYLIYQKLFNLNDGHSTRPTNKSLLFDVSKEELALCLHCFIKNRDPEACIFKKGRTGSFRHRKPKSDTTMYSKCVKRHQKDCVRIQILKGS